MSKKRILVVSHSLEEAITQCILKNKQHIEEDFSVVSLQELISDYDIFDELDDARKIITWYQDNKKCISNTDHFLLNRVLCVPNTLFNHFTKNDREYAQRELSAYLGFSFNTFSGIGNKSANGVCATIASLPQQWDTIKNKFKAKTPNYYWGPNYYNSLNEKNILVYSGIYNFLNWSITEKVPQDNHVFCFEKPKGDPVFILSIGNEQLVTSAFSITKNIEHNLKKLAREINNFFNYFISETLIFIDDGTLNFGCINPEVIRSTKNTYFDEFICKNLMNEFYKCSN